MNSKDKISKIKAAVLKKIKPKNRESKELIKKFLGSLESEIKKKTLHAKPVIGGSVGKNTHLTGQHDCDIFVKFNPKKYQDTEISNLLRKALSKFKPEVVHGSRDYYHVKKKIIFEIVPVLDISDPLKAINVTDMSPLHVKWVKKHPGFSDEIRLAKQFCKAAGVYGAESYIRGFSGHVLDILVIHYKGFEGLLRAAGKWTDKEVIDTEKVYKKNALDVLNKSKTDSPIIVIDPVFPKRNAAAALSYEKYELFKKEAESFLKSPSKDSFEIKDVTVKTLQEKTEKGRLVIIQATPLKGKEDVIGAKILKVFELLRNHLKFYDFHIIDLGWSWNKKDDALIWFVLDKKDLFPITKRAGPPTHETDRVKAFREKHKKTFIEDNRIHTYIKRQFTKPEKLIQKLIKERLITEKIKKIKMVEANARRKTKTKSKKH